MGIPLASAGGTVGLPPDPFLNMPRRPGLFIMPMAGHRYQPSVSVVFFVCSTGRWQVPFNLCGHGMHFAPTILAALGS